MCWDKFPMQACKEVVIGLLGALLQPPVLPLVARRLAAHWHSVMGKVSSPLPYAMELHDASTVVVCELCFYTEAKSSLFHHQAVLKNVCCFVAALQHASQGIDDMYTTCRLCLAASGVR